MPARSGPLPTTHAGIDKVLHKWPRLFRWDVSCWTLPEVLFRAGIHPARKAGAVSAKRVRSLVPLIRDVLGEAIEAGGSSLKDYRQADGELGYFQHNFAVYDQAGNPCPTDGCQKEISRIVQSGRSSFFCPQCQR